MRNYSNFDFIFEKKNQEYFYLIIFFITFAVFTVFAIGPSLRTIFQLNHQKKELQSLNNNLDQKINLILEINQAFQDKRLGIDLLNQAIPSSPEVNKLFSEIKEEVNKQSIVLRNIVLSDINLKEKEAYNVKPLNFLFEVESDFQNMSNFIQNIHKQKRLKSFREIYFFKDDKVITDSSKLKIKFILEGYYL